jgi:hypothetical protein
MQAHQIVRLGKAKRVNGTWRPGEGAEEGMKVRNCTSFVDFLLFCFLSLFTAPLCYAQADRDICWVGVPDRPPRMLKIQ